ncbi:hypothetical protein PROFUN_14952 [Planoprotostelium fungivorum]|uniref:Uncharacterized protein n=1 Tax=Planoprotostelium fungivorum TaxID=1890364 RepID=A0A2P6MYC9_9EUKA|nr:hypothetical protein PROFUN_14952 [Planoprotostelium fungivorum]
MKNLAARVNVHCHCIPLTKRLACSLSQIQRKVLLIQVHSQSNPDPYSLLQTTQLVGVSGSVFVMADNIEYKGDRDTKEHVEQEVTRRRAGVKRIYREYKKEARTRASERGRDGISGLTTCQAGIPIMSSKETLCVVKVGLELSKIVDHPASDVRTCKSGGRIKQDLFAQQITNSTMQEPTATFSITFSLFVPSVGGISSLLPNDHPSKGHSNSWYYQQIWKALHKFGYRRVHSVWACETTFSQATHHAAQLKNACSWMEVPGVVKQLDVLEVRPRLDRGAIINTPERAQPLNVRDNNSTDSLEAVPCGPSTEEMLEDILISDIDTRTLHNEIAVRLGVKYLADVDETVENKKSLPICMTDLINLNFRTMVAATVQFQRSKKRKTVIFLLDTGSPYSTLCEEVIQEFNADVTENFHIWFEGLQIAASLSAPQGNYRDINLLGAQSLASMSARIELNYADNAHKGTLNIGFDSL